MSGVKIEFSTEENMRCANSFCGEREALHIETRERHVRCCIGYDADERPLMLEAEAEAGVEVTLILLPHRIELYIDGALCDEEWPMGKCLFDAQSTVSGDLQLSICDYEEENKGQPAILYSFEGAENWRPEENVFVGDCMPYRKGDEYHVLYLKDRRHHRSKWGLGAHQWAHISTKDLKTWQMHPMAVEITQPEEGSICTGSWITVGEKEYLYYTVRMGGGKAAPIRRSVSMDGVHFKKDESFGFTLPSGYDAASARDPKVIRDENGIYHMLLTTSLTESKKGCLAHLISDDGEIWQDSGAPIYVAPAEDQPECPDYIAYGGRYYLIFSLRGRAHYLISERPFDGWRIPKCDEIPCHSVPKGAVWGDKVLFAGFLPCGGYGGNMTFCAAHADESGEWVFEHDVVPVWQE